VLEQVLVGIRWSPQLEKKLLSLRDIIAWHRIEFPKEKIDYGWVYLLVLLQESEKGMDFLVDISAPAWVRETYENIKKNKKDLTEKLLSARKNSEIYLLLKNKPLPFLLLLMTEKDLKEKVKVYLDKLRTVKIDPEKFKGLSGKQLGQFIEKEKMKFMDSL